MIDLDIVSFDGFTLDASARQLRYRGTVRPLRGKSLGVLAYLAGHPDRLVTQSELLRAMWPGVSVSPTVLRVCVREIRAALGHQTSTRLVTVAGRGYRFGIDRESGDGAEDTFVGRQREIAQLHEALIRARFGQRQLVFVAGEAGAGKSALLARFLDEVRATGQARISVGQCLELHSGLEPYAPVMDLLTRLCGETEGFVQMLERWAPSWLQHMQGTADPAAVEQARRRVPLPTSERMLRELSQTIEQLGNAAPLVLVLEDVHWSDASTLDAIAHLAQRSVATQLLVIATYRPNESPPQSDGLMAVMRRLCARGRATKIHLGRLAVRDVGDYLRRRLPMHSVGSDVIDSISRYSLGHPVHGHHGRHLLNLDRLVVRDGAWSIQGKLDGVIPERVGQLVASMMDRLDATTHRVLEAASVVGSSFSAAPVAAATSLSIEAVEAVCARLVDGGRLVATGVDAWPNGTVGASYQFAHALYADVLYDQLGPADRMRMHRSVAEAVDAGYVGDGVAVAALLARHFTLSSDPSRAVHFHTKAAIAAKERFAAREATVHLHSALDLLHSLPKTRERMGKELGCLLELAATSAVLHGFATAEVGKAYMRAAAHARRLNLLPAQIVAVAGQYAHHVGRAELSSAQYDAEQLAALAACTPAPFFTFLTDACLGGVLFSRGALADARRHLGKRTRCGTPVSHFSQSTRRSSVVARSRSLLVLGEDKAANAALQQLSTARLTWAASIQLRRRTRWRRSSMRPAARASPRASMPSRHTRWRSSTGLLPTGPRRRSCADGPIEMPTLSAKACRCGTIRDSAWRAHCWKRYLPTRCWTTATRMPP
jgi:DNA-binding winged helix-turn-helix (wHTH) protein